MVWLLRLGLGRVVRFIPVVHFYQSPAVRAPAECENDHSLWLYFFARASLTSIAPIGFDGAPSVLENPPRFHFPLPIAVKFFTLHLGLHFLVAIATALVWLSQMNTEADK